jgi:putative FmdB family regulatory protein
MTGRKPEPMPTYDYKCFGCEHQFEQFQSITAEPIRKCPKCGKRKVKRLLGIGAGLIFKGSGFYITDYRDKSYTEKAKAEAGGGDSKPADAPKSSESKTKSSDATAAAKSETKPSAAKSSESKKS